MICLLSLAGLGCSYGGAYDRSTVDPLTTKRELFKEQGQILSQKSEESSGAPDELNRGDIGRGSDEEEDEEQDEKVKQVRHSLLMEKVLKIRYS